MDSREWEPLTGRKGATAGCALAWNCSRHEPQRREVSNHALYTHTQGQHGPWGCEVWVATWHALTNGSACRTGAASGRALFVNDTPISWALVHAGGRL